MWNHTLLDHPYSSWLTALVLFVSVVLGAKLLFRLGLKQLQSLAQSTAWKGADFLLIVLKANNTLSALESK